MAELAHHEITEQIIGAAYEVYHHLGYGFLEKVYGQAMLLELSLRGLSAVREDPIQVKYKGIVVGEYKADLLVEKSVIVELKIAKEYQIQDEPQILNELKATEIKVGLLINFGKTKVAFKRFVY
ncbi:MAG: GxxExxY protein [Planctomycetota bacterium]